MMSINLAMQLTATKILIATKILKMGLYDLASAA